MGMDKKLTTKYLDEVKSLATGEGGGSPIRMFRTANGDTFFSLLLGVVDNGYVGALPGRLVVMEGAPNNDSTMVEYLPTNIVLSPKESTVLTQVNNRLYLAKYVAYLLNNVATLAEILVPEELTKVVDMLNTQAALLIQAQASERAEPAPRTRGGSFYHTPHATPQ